MEQEASAYITSVHLKGYKSIRDVSVTLNKGLNILIGANGSGKTNFLEFLDAAYNNNYVALFNGQNRKVEISISRNDETKKMIGEKVLKKSIKGLSSYIVEEEVKFSENSVGKAIYYLDENKVITNVQSDNNQDWVRQKDYSTQFIRFENPLNLILRDKLSLEISVYIDINEANKKYIRFWTSFLRSTNDFGTFLDDIFFYGNTFNEKNVNSIIKKITENQWSTIDELRRNLNQFSPIRNIKIDWELTRIRRQKDEGSESALIEGIDFQFYVNNEWINWTQLSDGTKRLFYLIGSVTYATKNEIILIEEPELGVHPHQLALLMNFLKSESDDKQIIISTHSPQVLNCLGEDDLDRIIVARHEGKTGTKLYHLSEEEKGFASEYMRNEAFLSDYWMLSGFMNEEQIENA
jgi:predicted ATPase